MQYLAAVIFYLIAAILFIYRIYDLSKKGERKILAKYLVFLIFASALFLHQNLDLGILLSGVIIFNMIISSYGSKLDYLYFLICVFYVIMEYGIGVPLLSQSILIGLLSGSALPRFYIKKETSKGIEYKRNAVQACAGVFLILIGYLLGLNAVGTAVIILTMLGIIIGSYAASNRTSTISKLVYKLERKQASLGSGALWLAIGSLVAVAFLNNVKLMVVVFSAIFIADSFSTIVGISLDGIKLPYNTKKTLSGTTAYFIATAAVSYLFVGIWAVPLGLVAAFSESIKMPLDDNFFVSLVMTLILTTLIYFHIIVL